jgi:D-alanine-D-alanine ligase
MLHGTGAEDGTLQIRLNRLGIPWFGSSAEASALTFDKVATRNTLAAAGLPVASGLALRSDAPREWVRDASHQIGYPQVIKPSAQGSSVGITIVDSDPEVYQGIRVRRALGRPRADRKIHRGPGSDRPGNRG